MTHSLRVVSQRALWWWTACAKPNTIDPIMAIQSAASLFDTLSSSRIGWRWSSPSAPDCRTSRSSCLTLRFRKWPVLTTRDLKTHGRFNEFLHRFFISDWMQLVPATGQTRTWWTTPAIASTIAQRFEVTWPWPVSKALPVRKSTARSAMRAAVRKARWPVSLPTCRACLAAISSTPKWRSIWSNRVIWWPNRLRSKSCPSRCRKSFCWTSICASPAWGRTNASSQSCASAWPASTRWVCWRSTTRWTRCSAPSRSPGRNSCNVLSCSRAS